MRTDLSLEREAQRAWRLRAIYRDMTAFDELVEMEFRDEEWLRSYQNSALRDMVGFAAAQVPYYRDLFAARGLGASDIAEAAHLNRLPLLDKLTLRDNEVRLQPGRLPSGEKRYGVFTSSGTTGRPTRVIHSVASNANFTYSTQRIYRWFRFDPLAVHATIRLASQLPRFGRGHNPDGATQRLPRWRYVGRYFETGPALGFNITNPVERQIEWLRAERPQYLMSYSESLEHICFATGHTRPVDSITGLHAISEQMTPSMRRSIERGFTAPVHQGYGLNEIGLVAVRCQAGRYHVHVEHCLVEIVDDQGQPCRAGQTGRIAITALRNLAMPLIRYDTDDMAVAVEGPCPCGRTLPSFGEIAGRYSRIAFLPEGTLGLVAALREALETMPDDLARNLRRFQAHQFRDGRFALRLAVAGPLPAAFRERVFAAWGAAAGTAAPALDILEVDEILRSAGGKFQDFTSDHMPARDAEAEIP